MGIFLFVRPEQKLTKEKLLRRPTALRCAVKQRNACFPPPPPPPPPAPSPSVFIISNTPQVLALSARSSVTDLHAHPYLAIQQLTAVSSRGQPCLLSRQASVACLISSTPRSP
jgi:hypothetical protein